MCEGGWFDKLILVGVLWVFMNLKKLIIFILVFFASFSVLSASYYGSSGNYIGKSQGNSYGGTSYLFSY